MCLCLLNLYRRLTYGGEFIEGKWHGEGTYVHRNGAYYEGHWINGLKNGHGKFCYSNGAVYEGDWKNDLKHGNGIYFHPDGSVYTGQFYNDKRHGEGILVLKNGDEYIGTFSDGSWCGGIVSKSNEKDTTVKSAIKAFEIASDTKDNSVASSPEEEYHIPLLSQAYR